GCFFFSRRRRHTRFSRDWSSDVCSSDLLADGVLIDAGPLAREAGFVWPVAYTAAAHAATITWDTANGALQDETGRAWDVLWMAKIGRASGRDRVDGAVAPGVRAHLP